MPPRSVSPSRTSSKRMVCNKKNKNKAKAGSGHMWLTVTQFVRRLKRSIGLRGGNMKSSSGSPSALGRGSFGKVYALPAMQTVKILGVRPLLMPDNTVSLEEVEEVVESYEKLQRILPNTVFKLFVSSKDYKDEAQSSRLVAAVVVKEERQKSTVPHILKRMALQGRKDVFVYGLQVLPDMGAPSVYCTVYEQMDMNLGEYLQTADGRKLLDMRTLEQKVKPEIDLFLDALHRNDLYHRDMKAENIVVRLPKSGFSLKKEQASFYVCDYGGIGPGVALAATYPSPYLIKAATPMMHEFVDLPPGQQPTPANYFDAFYRERMGGGGLVTWKALMGDSADIDQIWYDDAQMMRHNDDFGFWASMLNHAQRAKNMDLVTTLFRRLSEPIAASSTPPRASLKETAPGTNAKGSASPSASRVYDWERRVLEITANGQVRLQECQLNMIAVMCSGVEDIAARQPFLQLLVKLQMQGKDVQQRIHLSSDMCAANKPGERPMQSIVVQATDTAGMSCSMDVYSALIGASGQGRKTWTIVDVSIEPARGLGLMNTIAVKMSLRQNQNAPPAGGARAKANTSRQRQPLAFTAAERQQWKRNPLVNPRTGRAISPAGRVYKALRLQTSRIMKA